MARVTIIVPSFPRLSETFIVGKFLGLLEQGVDVHVVCTKSPGVDWLKFDQLRKRSKQLRRRVHVCWPHRPRSLAAALTVLAVVRCLVRQPGKTSRYLTRGWRKFGADILRRLYLDAELICLGPDLIHFEFGALATERMYLADLLSAKIVVSFRGYDLNYVGLGKANYYKQVWDQAAHVHLLGQDLWRRAQRRGCAPDTPHTLIPPAIDTAFYDPGERKHCDVVGTRERPLRLLSVGRLDWRKGYEYALQAVQMLRSQGVVCEYHIIGEGDFLEPLAFARHQLGLEDVVHLQGAQIRERVKQAMLWADVFLHAAVSEGFCNSVVEAQAMSLPVVCSDAGGLPENVAHGETGFVVPRRNAQLIAENLVSLAQNPLLREQMGQAGRERALLGFNLTDQIHAFEQLYEKTLDTKVKAAKHAPPERVHPVSTRN